MSLMVLTMLWWCTSQSEIDAIKQQNILLQQQLQQQQEEANNIEQQKLEFEQQKYEEEKYNEYRKECLVIKEENTQKFEDFINTCTRYNTIDFCLASDAGKYFPTITNEKFLNDCIEAKK